MSVSQRGIDDLFPDGLAWVRDPFGNSFVWGFCFYGLAEGIAAHTIF